MSNFNPLLPCPFCEGEMVVEPIEMNGSTVYSTSCNNNLCPFASALGDFVCTPERAIRVWNTRVVDGHEVTFIREEAGVISPGPCWLVIANSRMFGPCDTWHEVAGEIARSWDDERLLVG